MTPRSTTKSTASQATLPCLNPAKKAWWDQPKTFASDSRCRRCKRRIIHGIDHASSVATIEFHATCDPGQLDRTQTLMAQILKRPTFVLAGIPGQQKIYAHTPFRLPTLIYPYQRLTADEAIVLAEHSCNSPPLSIKPVTLKTYVDFPPDPPY